MSSQKKLSWNGLIDAYRDFLPVKRSTPIVTLNEGNTPLVHSQKLSKKIGFDIYLKVEGANPTGSFKDRGMTLAVSKAVEDKSKAVLCASTGNTSASAASYAARAGIKCYVLLPEGAVALGKLSQALMCNARVIPIRGNFDDALRLARQITAHQPIALVNSVNPFRIHGQKTGAFEICDQLGGMAPDYHLIPVGNAGNITAYWKGYCDYVKKGYVNKLPVMLGFQAKGADPMVRGKVVSSPKTFATAIRIGNPASWMPAEMAKRESGGQIHSVTDKQIKDAYCWLAKEEGVFVEPASAASVAGLFLMKSKGYFKKAKKKSVAVCILTGHGLKDPQSALGCIRMPKTIPATENAVLKALR